MKFRLIIFLLTYLLLFLSFCGCTGGHLRGATPYQQSDFEGSWTMIGFGHKGKVPFNTLSSLTMNDSGTITGGDTIEFGYDSKVFTGGKLLFTQDDTLTGEINTYLPDVDLHDKHVIISGKMHAERDLIIFSGRFPVFHRGLGILIKKSQNYQSSDLEGWWSFPVKNYMLSVFITPAGTINECIISGLGEILICSGIISVNSEGAITGQIAYKEKKDNLEIFFNGQMNKNKDIMIFGGSISTSFEGLTSFAIKKYDNPVITDTKGNWLIYMTADGDAIFGRITVVDGGFINIANLQLLSGSTIDVNGKLQIQKDSVSGILKNESNTIFLEGSINKERNFGGGVYKDNFTNSGVFVLIRDFRF